MMFFNKLGGRLAGLAFFVALLLGGLIWVRASAHGFNWTLFGDTISRLDPSWTLLGLAFAWSTYLIRALRWRILLIPVRPRAPIMPLLNDTVIGFTAGTVLGRAGEMVRPYLIANTNDVPFPSQLAAWIVERIYDTLIALAIFGFAMTQVSGATVGPTLGWALAIGGFVIAGGTSACLALLLLMRYRSLHLERWALGAVRFLESHHLERAERLIVSFINGFRSVRSQGATVRLILYTAAEWVVVGACYACVVKAFGGGTVLSAADILVVMGFATFGSLVQLPAVGGGVQVTIVLVLTEIFGVGFEAATGIGLVVWLLLWVSITPVGAALALGQGLTWARLRTAGQDLQNK